MEAAENKGSRTRREIRSEIARGADIKIQGEQRGRYVQRIRAKYQGMPWLRSLGRGRGQGGRLRQRQLKRAFWLAARVCAKGKGVRPVITNAAA